MSNPSGKRSHRDGAPRDAPRLNFVGLTGSFSASSGSRRGTSGIQERVRQPVGDRGRPRRRGWREQPVTPQSRRALTYV